jgi:cytochrome P450
VVRISPDELSFINPQAWRDIYGHGSKEGKGSVPPKNWTRYMRSVNGANNLITIEDSIKHAQTRKIFTSAFSDRALTQQAPIFTKYADQLVESLKRGRDEGAKFDMIRMYNFTTFDVMGDLTFGEPLHMLDNAEYDPWVKIIFKNFKRATHLSIIYNHYPLAARVFRAMLHKTVAKVQYIHLNHSATRVTKRLEKGRASEGIDLWDLVLKQEEKGTVGLTRAEMDVNAGLFMVAGTETTATLLSGLTYLLLTHPESMKKLVTEVRGAFASSDEVTMEAIAALPYLNACIKEAFRRYPPVPVGLPHRTPQEGSTICGHYVPPNVSHSTPF